MTHLGKKDFISRRSITVFVIAIVMGFISGKFLFHGSALNILPWGILALMTAFIATNKRQALTFGGLFGFIVSYSFLWFNNSNIKSVGQVLFLIVLVTLPALFGLLCGLIAAGLGWKIRSVIKKQNA